MIRKKIDQKEDFTKKYNAEFELEQLKEIKSLMEEVMKTDPKLIKKVKKEMKS